MKFDIGEVNEKLYGCQTDSIVIFYYILHSCYVGYPNLSMVGIKKVN
jgi:hypothetical protein